jgi:hypothetical protein
MTFGCEPGNCLFWETITTLMKSLLRLPFFILMSTALYISGCDAPPQNADDNTSAMENNQASSDNLAPVTVEEFFEYLKNPHFEESEKIADKIPHYARRMMEVRVTRDAAAVEKAKRASVPIPKPYPSDSPSETKKPTEADKVKMQETLATLGKIYGQSLGLTADQVFDFMNTGWQFDPRMETDYPLAALSAAKLAFTMGVEGGYPVDYVREIYQLSKKGIFEPGYLSQVEVEEDEMPYAGSVQFVLQDVLFVFYPSKQDDYVDQQILLSAINLSLRCAGKKERYYALWDDGTAVVAEPGQFLALCEAFGWKMA